MFLPAATHPLSRKHKINPAFVRSKGIDIVLICSFFMLRHSFLPIGDQKFLEHSCLFRLLRGVYSLQVGVKTVVLRFEGYFCFSKG